MDKFPLDNGKLWEGDLEAKLGFIPPIDFDKAYYADVKRFGGWLAPETADEDNRLFNEALAAGKTNIDSFIQIGLKAHSSNLLSCAGIYLTAYTNEIFKYVCNSTISIDNIYEDYNELVSAARTNTTVRFGLNMINDIITGFIESNSEDENHISVDTGGIDGRLLLGFFRIRIAFNVIPFFIAKAIQDRSNIAPTLDEKGLYLDVVKNSQLYNTIKERLDGQFHKRSLRLYMRNYDNTNIYRSVTIYQTFSNDYKIRLI